MIDRPLYAAVRKGKERFVCDIRLAQRLEAVREKEKNEKQFKALLSLRGKLDLDQLPELKRILTAGRYAFPHIVPQIVRVPGAAGTTGICGRSRGARA